MQIGERIRNLRLARNLTQEELAERADLTKGFISVLERDQTSISVDSLDQILKVLNVKISDFFREIDRPQVVYGPEERTSIADTGATTFELLIPGGADRKMEAARVVLEPGEVTYSVKPYRGEAFGIVIRGSICIAFGNEVHEAPAESSFYFSGDREHIIENRGEQPAEFYWVSTPPTF
ncbi:XRE family transcriptional regulator [bacterium]|nr:XRE family transcriptional regulator [bacterium]MBU1636878.1 XRE family transcriptional regulator [bacterium]MBU1919380.1 XRE family transcriptional regulator [bacterium]